MPAPTRSQLAPIVKALCQSEGLRGEHAPETETYGISSFVYRTRRPFDAVRLHAFFHADEPWSRVLRSKGFFWIAADRPIMPRWLLSRRISSWR